MSRKLQDGLAPTSVQTHYRLLHEALGHAVRWGLLTRNPAATADPPKRRRFEPHVWDEEQVRLFLAEAKRASRYYPLYLTAVMTGMRAGELAGLRWQDVDLTYGVASVRQTLYRLNGSTAAGRAPQTVFKTPKTAVSRRAVALPEAVVDALRTLRADQDENRRLLGPDYHDYGLVFCQPNGKPLHLHNVVRRDFRRTINRAGVPRIRFHDLRHLHASYLARAGVPPKVAQERLGHATPGFTMQVYTHVLAGQQEAAARAVEAHLLGRSDRAFADVCNPAPSGPRNANRDEG
ncbi:MAG: site-specific integrase [Armatimonadota bacterium]|nr:site-specific integrase [Armatimonadota bacterium]MDR7427450.1 site-specific integrase [Armatimonadota bacterium]MDR7465046.1 site-specific integrase [Armatimonadota bacterium]MDR7469990.1 site-specific integrase [Armatimonadota bacterium]MDR7540359.1 site-specific integrase [Armatimonadota bacterium]